MARTFIAAGCVQRVAFSSSYFFAISSPCAFASSSTSASLALTLSRNMKGLKRTQAIAAPSCSAVYAAFTSSSETFAPAIAAWTTLPRKRSRR